MKIGFSFSICIALMFVLVLISGCEKSETENQCDVCNGIFAISADFSIEELATLPGDDELRTLTDTAYSGKSIRFHALEDDAEYTWCIGSEVIYDRTVYRYFPAELAFQDIPIKLRVDKLPHEICYPEDDGIDSIQQVLTLSAPYDSDEFYEEEYNHRFDGLFRFYDSYTQDSVDLKIERWHFGLGEPSFTFEHVKIININSTGDYFNSGTVEYGDTIFIYDDTGKINYRELWYSFNGLGIRSFSHDINGKVEFKLVPSMTSNQEIDRCFTGRKL